MTLYVYNAAIERIGIVEEYDSLQWLSKYQDAGEVKLVCANTSKNRELLVDGNRLYCTDQQSSAIIRQVTVQDDGKTSSLTVRALLSPARWGDRVVLATENITAAGAGMVAMVNNNRRGLPGATAAFTDQDVPMDTQVTWGSVLEGLQVLSKASGLGFRENFNPNTGVETFTVYAGTDRTSGTPYNGYFGNDAKNITKTSYVTGTVDWKNVAIVGGEGEGTARKVVTAQLNPGTGDDRRELWVDAKDLTSTYQLATTDSSGNVTYTQATYTPEEYAAQLEARGLEKLAENLPTVEVDANLGQGLMEYGKDYFLGDIVPLKLSQFGITLSARVSQVTTAYEGTGKIVRATLSDYKIQEGKT